MEASVYRNALWRDTVPYRQNYQAVKQGCHQCMQRDGRQWASVCATSEHEVDYFNAVLQNCNQRIVTKCCGKHQGALTPEQHEELRNILVGDITLPKDAEVCLGVDPDDVAILGNVTLSQAIVPLALEWRGSNNMMLGTVRAHRESDIETYLNELGNSPVREEDEELVLLPDAVKYFVGKKKWFLKRYRQKHKHSIHISRLSGDPLKRRVVRGPHNVECAEKIKDRVARCNLYAYPYCICDDVDGWMFVM